MRVCPVRIGEVVDFASSDNPHDVYPATTWERVKDSFALASGDSYALGAAGGSTSHAHTTQAHTLTVQEMPSHSHAYRLFFDSRTITSVANGPKQGKFQAAYASANTTNSYISPHVENHLLATGGGRLTATGTRVHPRTCRRMSLSTDGSGLLKTA